MATPLHAYFAALVAHETSLWNAIDRRLADQGAVRLGRLEFFRALKSLDDARVQDIAAALGITVGAASRLTDRLVTDGLVVRSQHPTDRRSSYIRATEAGEQSLDSAEAAFTVAIKELLSGTPLAELKQITNFLERVALETAGASKGAS